MATVTAKRQRKAKAKAARRRVRRSSAKAAGRRKVPGTTVVHVDPQVYSLLNKERRPDDRSMNAPLRRLLNLEPLSAAVA